MTDAEQGSPQNEAVEIDLGRGEVRDRNSGRVLTRLCPWNRRERVLTTELCLASTCGAGGQHLFEMTLGWWGWLENAASFQVIRNRLNAPRSTLNKLLRPYGWHVKQIGTFRYSLAHIDGSTGPAASITAQDALPMIAAADAAFRRRDYAEALSAATTAIRTCGDSRSLRLFIATCCFVHGQRAGEDLMVETAAYVLSYEHVLIKQRDVIAELWRRQIDRRKRWDCACDAIRDCEEQLRVYAMVFENARRYLHGDDR